MYIKNQSKLTFEELNNAIDEAMRKSGTDVVPIYTLKCFHCGNYGFVIARRSDYDAWVNGELIQNAFPEMPAERREQLLSGIHPECFDEIYSDLNMFESGQ